MYEPNTPLAFRRRDACHLKQQAGHITYPRKTEKHPANRDAVIYRIVTLSHKKS